MFQGPWLALAPGLCLTVVVYATNMFGDALRDLLDPRMRGSPSLIPSSNKREAVENQNKSYDKRNMQVMLKLDKKLTTWTLGLGLALDAAGSAWAQAEKPQYGGTLEVVTVYPTISALSFDPSRLELEAQPRHRQVPTTCCSPPTCGGQRKGGKHRSCRRLLPWDAIRGELVES